MPTSDETERKMRHIEKVAAQRAEEGLEVTTSDTTTGESSTETVYPVLAPNAAHVIPDRSTETVTTELDRLRDRHRRIAELQAGETDRELAEMLDGVQMAYADLIRDEEARERIRAEYGDLPQSPEHEDGIPRIYGERADDA
jgi:hypothetical protein